MKQLNEDGFIVAQNAVAHQLTIKHFLKNTLRIQPENEIVYKDTFRYNYYEFNNRVNQFANLLFTLGYAGHATIGMVDYDSHRYLEAYFAVPCTGNILHTVNWRLSAEQIVYTINHAEDDILIIHEDFLPIFEQFKDQLTTVKTFILIKDSDKSIESTIPFIGDYESLIKAQPKTFEYPDFSENTIATLFYTTGTTGNPKGVYFTHRQLTVHGLMEMAYFGIANSYFKLESKDIYMPFTPMFHVHAWGIPYVATAMNLKQVYMGKFDPALFLKLFLTEKPTFSHSVPTILNMILAHPATSNVDFSNWKILIGGAALPESLARLAMERGITILTGYGMSETGPILSVSKYNEQDLNADLDEKVRLSTFTGRSVILTDIKLVDEDGNKVPKDGKTVGEIVAQSPTLTSGYYKDPTASEALWEGGYLHTGDLAVWNEQEDIKIVDRLKDVIKTGGEWVSSIDIESLILLHPSVLETAIIGIPDKQWDERPLALVVIKEHHILDKQELVQHLQQFVTAHRINKWAIPEQIHFVTEIPKTSVGKINKKEIRRLCIKD